MAVAPVKADYNTETNEIEKSSTAGDETKIANDNKLEPVPPDVTKPFDDQAWQKFQSEPKLRHLFAPQRDLEVSYATITPNFTKDKIYSKTVDAQGISESQLIAAVQDFAGYNKKALKLESCASLGIETVNYKGKSTTARLAHMAVNFGVYQAQWVIAMFEPEHTDKGLEINWALVPSDQVPKAGQDLVSEYGYHYMTYDVGGWRLKDNKLTYWVSADPTGLWGWVADMANTQGLDTNLSEMIKSAKQR